VSESKPAVPPQDATGLLEPIIAKVIERFIVEYTNRIFPQMDSQAIDCLSRAIALAVSNFEKRTGTPMAQTLAYNLLDRKAP